MFKNKNVMPYISAIIYSIIFGLSFLFTKKALVAASTFKLLSFRFMLAFIVMSVLILFKIIKVNYKDKPIKDLLIACIAQPVIYFIFETYAIKYTSSSYTGLFVALIPISVSIMGIYFLKEMPSKIQWVFIVTSVLGVVYILLNDFTSAVGNGIILGTIFLLIAIISASIFSIYSRKISSYFSSFEITYFMMGVAALVFNIVSLSLDILSGNLRNYFEPLLNNDVIVAVIYLGLLSSIVAYYFMNYSLSKMSASKCMVFANLATIISIIAGVIFMNEKFYYYHVIGSIMIIGGIVGANYFKTIDIKSENTKDLN